MLLNKLSLETFVKNFRSTILSKNTKKTVLVKTTVPK